MRINGDMLFSIAYRHRKWIAVGLFSFFAFATILVVGAGYLVYQTASYATEKFQSSDKALELPQLALPKPGFVEGVVLSMATAWLQQGLGSAEVRSVKDGLTCFDAIGGPSPVDIVSYVEGKTTDPQIQEQLNNLKGKLASVSASANGPAACASWMMSS